MWARVIEFTIACWIALSPFIFRYPGDAVFFWTSDLITSSLIAFFSLVSFYKPLRKMHLFNVLVSFYLILLGYIFKEGAYPEPLQNYVVLGLLLVMIAIVPSETNKPPVPWREFYGKGQ